MLCINTGYNLASVLWGIDAGIQNGGINWTACFHTVIYGVSDSLGVAYIAAFTLLEFFSTLILLIFPLFVVWFLVFAPFCYPRIVDVCGSGDD